MKFPWSFLKETREFLVLLIFFIIGIQTDQKNMMDDASLLIVVVAWLMCLSGFLGVFFPSPRKFFIKWTVIAMVGIILGDVYVMVEYPQLRPIIPAIRLEDIPWMRPFTPPEVG